MELGGCWVGVHWRMKALVSLVLGTPPGGACMRVLVFLLERSDSSLAWRTASEHGPGKDSATHVTPIKHAGQRMHGQALPCFFVCHGALPWCLPRCFTTVLTTVLYHGALPRCLPQFFTTVLYHGAYHSYLPRCFALPRCFTMVLYCGTPAVRLSTERFISAAHDHKSSARYSLADCRSPSHSRHNGRHANGCLHGAISDGWQWFAGPGNRPKWGVSVGGGQTRKGSPDLCLLHASSATIAANADIAPAVLPLQRAV